MDTQRTPTADQIRTAWDGLASGFDEFVTPETASIAQETLRILDLQPGMRLVDVAAGTGALSFPAARTGAHVVATDISPVMIDLLNDRARAEGLANVEGRAMDGTALDLEADTFDVAVSVNGVSLFPDLPTSLAEMVRVTKPGGRVVLVSFGPPPAVEFIGFVMGAMKAEVPGFTPLPVDPPPLPFQVADPDVMRSRLTEAGLSEVSVHRSTCHMSFDSAERLLTTFMFSNPIGARFVAELTAEQKSAVEQRLAGMLKDRAGEQGRSGDQSGSDNRGAELHCAVNIGVGIVS
ncbi:MAG: methyltransferase domain-containing protein [Rhodococcus sp.]|nr:methyltransferase domain-containing protein [Rhodococcus sp. (in: high G+C Gram-positive bacteria)]